MRVLARSASSSGAYGSCGVVELTLGASTDRTSPHKMQSHQRRNQISDNEVLRTRPTRYACPRPEAIVVRSLR